MSLQARGSGLFERHCLAFHEQGLERLFRKLLAKPRPDGFAHELAHPVRNRAAISIDSLDRSHESRGAIELAYRFEHPGKADECVLAGHRLASRDLLQVDVLNASRKERLFTIFNNHLKSHFVRFTAGDPAAEQARANELRRRQCQAAAAIIVAETRPNSRYLVLGDMNDPPDSEVMTPLAESTQLKLTFGLTTPTEPRPASGSPCAAHRRLDGTLQAQRQTSRLHAHGPGLAQPGARRQAGGAFIDHGADVAARLIADASRLRLERAARIESISITGPPEFR
jgi:hypothetical protein